MKTRRTLSSLLVGFAVQTAAMAAVSSWAAQPAAAQDAPMQQRIAEVKQSAAKNKQALAQYSWRQEETITIKGEVKDTKLFQVHVGPAGKPQKVEMENMPQSSGGPQHGPAHHIKEKKSEEYSEYGQQITALAEQYAQPDPERLQQAFQQGNVMVGAGGFPGEVKMVITNYIKPNDKMTLTLNREANAIQNMDVATYLDDPKNAVQIGAQFSQLPDGTNHVETMQMKGVSKHLLITTRNSNYQGNSF